MYKKDIDRAKFEELLKTGISRAEMCDALAVSRNTLVTWVSKTYNCNYTEIKALVCTKLDKSQFEELCKIQCTQEEICAVLKADYKKVDAWCKKEYGCSFAEAQSTYALDGKKSLRRAQFELAKNNPQMAIWLGKQVLGQKDVVEQDIKAVVNDTHTQIIEKLSERVDLKDGEDE